MHRKLAIYGVEKPVLSWTSGKIDHYHSFLGLFDETGGTILGRDFIEAEQELHFLDDGADILTAGVYTRERHPETGLVLTGYTSGPEEPVRALWNRALCVGVAVKKACPEFNKAAQEEGVFNCRSGVEAALEAMGFTFTPVDQAMRCGVNKNLLSHVGRFMPAAGNASDVFEEGRKWLREIAGPAGQACIIR